MRQVTQAFKCLSDSIRLRILLLLEAEGELCVCDLMAVLALPQSTVSRHLAYLKRGGWLDDRRYGVWMYYAISQNVSSFHLDLLNLLKNHITDNGALSDRNILAEFQIKKQANPKCLER